jgi:hypothetical protein
MREDDDHDGLLFQSDDFKPDCADLPAFTLRWKDFIHCSGLPAPEAPFALLLDYVGKDDPKDDPGKESRPPAGFTDVDVSNILRMRYLRLGEGEGVDMRPLIHGLQRLQQLETLQLSVGVEFLRALKDSPALLSLKEMTVYAAARDEYLSAVGGLKQLTRVRVNSAGPAIDLKAPGPHGRIIGLRHLAGLPALKTLELDWCQVLTDDELAEVAKIPALRSLSITRCALITAKGLNALAGAKKLEGLDIAEGPATDGGWTEAGKMTGLRRLRIGGPAVTDAALERIAAIPGLRSLTLKACDNVTDAGFARLAAQRGLESLGLWFCKNLGEQGTKAIGTLKGLRHLRTGYCPGVTDDRLNHFADLVELRELDLRGCTALTDVGVAKVGRFNRLEVLHLWVCPKLTEKSIASVCGLRELRVLEFYMSDGVRADDRDMAALGGLKHLRRLTLPNCRRVTVEGYRSLAGLPGLEELGMRNCSELTDATLKELAAPRRLKMLTLSLTDDVTDTGLQELTGLRLRVLWMHGCKKITPDGIAAFARANPRCDVTIEPDWRPPSPPKE